MAALDRWVYCIQGYENRASPVCIWQWAASGRSLSILLLFQRRNIQVDSVEQADPEELRQILVVALDEGAKKGSSMISIHV